MERPIESWNGVPEVGGICRTKRETLINKIHEAAKQEITKAYAAEIVDALFAEIKDMDCINATEPRFQEFSCKTWSDEAVIQKYIEKLIFSCEKWRNP